MERPRQGEDTDLYHYDGDYGLWLPKRFRKPRKRHIGVDRWVELLFSGVLVAANIALWIYTGTLADQARAQADFNVRHALPLTTASATAAIKSAQTAENALHDSRNTFIQDQRPYLMASVVKPFPLAAGTAITVNLYWANYGKSPALGMIGRGAVFFGKDAMRRADAWFKTEANKPFPNNIARAIVPPGVPTGKDGDLGNFSTFSSNSVLNAADLDFVIRNDFSAVIVSHIEYFDLSANRYWTDGCWSHFATGAIPSCPTHNEVH